MNIDEIFDANFSEIGDGIRPTQRKIMESVLDNTNTLGLMPTGSGKSLCYWISGIALDGITLVVFPLTALMDEQAMKLERYGFKVFRLHSGINSQAQYRELLSLYNMEDPPDFIFFSPERLATDGFLEYVLKHIRKSIKLVVVDEAHCISQWGLDFRPFYKEIPHFLNAVFAESQWPTVLCLTATLNPMDTQEICKDFFIDQDSIIRHDFLLRPEISIRIEKIPDENTKDERFWELMDAHKDEKVLVYVDRKRGKRSTETLCRDAIDRGFLAAYFHGDMTSDAKAEVIEKFKSGYLLTVFATSAFGMGIDIPDIRGVVHYLLTESAEQYYQQIGRVGRDNEPSWAVLYFSDKNVQVRKTHFIDKSFPNEDEVRIAFQNLTDGQIGRRTVNYFDEGDETQSAYHYLVRSDIIKPICKGVQNVSVFEVSPKVDLPEFEKLLETSRTGLLIYLAQKRGVSEPNLLDNIYKWLVNGEIRTHRAPGKCLVIESTSAELPEDLLKSILDDVKEKKGYRTSLFNEFVNLIEGYSSSGEFHQAIGECLGIDRFRMGRIHQTLSGEMVRSKSEVIIANILFQTGIPFRYEELLVAPDGSSRLPDFTIDWRGKTYYWEHWGLLDQEDYAQRMEMKMEWYEKHFPGKLVSTMESSTLSRETKKLITSNFGIDAVYLESS